MILLGKKWRATLALALGLLVLASCQPNRQKTARPAPETVLYVHGYSGGKGSTNFLINYAVAHAGATKALVATVNASGKVHFTGRWPQTATRPLVQVIFQQNRDPDPAHLSLWLRNVTRALKQRYGVKKIGIVAHSMGNNATMAYELRDGKKPGQPQLVHYVAIAASINGIVDPNIGNAALTGITGNATGAQFAHNVFAKDGRPKYQTPDYRQLAALRDQWPAGVEVLNLIGDLKDGSESDGRVPVASARSLRYLMPTAALYATRIFTGKSAQHSALHENAQVAKAVDDFIWK
ncbi:alpha/beta hydrolase [Lacticaseibacillus yichunensis]|uniref:Alpha/beta hydrolase n=1 Tax=Lacticaseibacillus yichunensis TaxID=2486015 RepID=A0ABW4CSS4_9LACO|nr:alpha/beta hydrolase [Lacticaseibacillus yichunensis]